MKFKLIFALFNVIIAISFVFVFLMPLFVIPIATVLSFWAQYWYLIVVFLLILAVIDSYFLINWRMFVLLESENWTGLAALLEKRLFEQKKVSDQNVKLLYRAWLVQGKLSHMRKLETLVRARHPKRMPRYALSLGVSYLLENKPEQIVAYFSEFKDLGGEDAAWINFNLSLGYLGAERMQDAHDTLQALALQDKHLLPKLLAVYLLRPGESFSQEFDGQLGQALQYLRIKLDHARFQKLMYKDGDNLQLVILAKLLEEASAWFFDKQQKKGENEHE